MWLQHCVIEFEREPDGSLTVLDIRDFKSHGYRANDVNRMKKTPGAIYATYHKGKMSRIRQVTENGYILIRP